jgi:hypothetical protein
MHPTSSEGSLAHAACVACTVADCAMVPNVRRKSSGRCARANDALPNRQRSANDLRHIGTVVSPDRAARPNVTSIGAVFNAAPITSSIQCIARQHSGNVSADASHYRRAHIAICQLRTLMMDRRAPGIASIKMSCRLQSSSGDSKLIPMTSPPGRARSPALSSPCLRSCRRYGESAAAYTIVAA